MIHLLGLLKNPFVKIIAEKTVGAISHKLKKDAIIRQKELDHANNTDVQSLKSSENSLKDEWLVIVFSLIFWRILYHLSRMPCKEAGRFWNLLVIISG